MTEPTIRTILLDRIARHCTQAGITERKFGYLAVQDYRFVDQVRADKATLRVIGKAEEYLRDHVPAPVAAPVIQATAA